MPEPKIRLNLSTLGQLQQPPNPGIGWVGPERPAESWADIAADPLSALFDLGRGAVTGDAPPGMNLQGLGSILGAALPVAQGAKSLRALTKAVAIEDAAQQGIKAYHGSPHDFDQFSLSKIGTGEGAQAYGHGLYFAENPATAEGYRSSLAGQPEIKLLKVGSKTAGQHNGFDYSPRGNSTYENIQSSLIEDLLIDQQGTLGVPPDQLQAHVLKTLDGKIADYEKEWPQAVADAKRLRADLAKRGAVKLEMGERPGKTYEVQIHASPDQFLDWDKPLSEQPKLAEAISAKFDKGGTLGYQRDVSGYGEDFEPRSLMRWAPDDRTDMAKLQSLQKAADDAHKATQRSGYDAASRKAADDAIEAYMQYIDHAQQTSGKWSVDPSKTGSDLYKSVVSQFGGPNKGGAEVASQVLRDQFKIPGIRYLDAGSRSAGEGSRNYVIFDENLVSILKKYGVALPVIEGLRERAKQNGGVISRQDVDGLEQ